MDKLKLKPGVGTLRPQSRDDVQAVSVYESSLKHQVTDEPLVTIAVRGVGMRLMPSQVQELHDWLSEWLKEKEDEINATKTS